MRLTISSTSTSQIITLDIPSDVTINDLKALINAELPSLPAASQHLYYHGRLLSDASKTLEQCGMKDEDMVVVHSRGPAAAAAPQPARQAAPVPRQAQHHDQAMGFDPEMIRLQVLANDGLLENLRAHNPGLADAINDPVAFGNAFREMERQKAEAERAKQREIQMLNEDPFNVEAQQKIEELIRQEQVMENLQSALEHHPEVTFGNVIMLYIPVEVNSVPVKAFVDSGAQATIMSPDCAQRCGIMRLVDTRFAGIARGVGTAKILGRVHSAPIRIGNLFLPCSFTVMEGKDVDLLLGLDMLKRHQATIDLRNNKLVVRDEEVEFLGESEIPKNSVTGSEPTVEGPSGAQISGRTGAVIEPPIQSTPSASVMASSSSSSATRAPAPPKTEHPSETISQLVALGFSREDAIAALDIAEGNADIAASYLFN